MAGLNRALLFTAAYVLIGRASLLINSPADGLSAVWPAAGVAFAGLWLCGIRFAPLFVLGDLITTVWNGFEIAPFGLIIAAGNIGGLTFGVWLTRRCSHQGEFLDRTTPMACFFLFGCIVSGLLAASFGMSAFALEGIAGGVGGLSFAQVFWTWFLSDSIGAAVAAPMIIAWGQRGWRSPLLPGWLEFAAMTAAFVALNIMVFGQAHNEQIARYPLALAFMPMAIWAAYRLGARMTTTGVFLGAGVAVAGTLLGRGPWSAESVTQALLPLQSFVAVMSATALILHATVVERKQALASLRESQEALRSANVELEERVSERTRDLSRAEARFRGMYEHAVQGMMQTTPRGRIRMLNDAFAHMLGYESSHEFLALPDPLNRIYFDIGERERWLRALLREGVLQNFEARLRHRDGHEVWVLASLWTTRDQDGETLVEGIVVDNTERRRAEIELRRSEEKNRRIISTAAEGFLLLDSEFRIEDANEAMLRLCGYSLDDVRGQLPVALAAESSKPFWEADRDQLLREGRVTREADLACKDGDLTPVLIHASLMRDSDDNVLGCVVFFTDLTEIKQAEQLRQDVDRIMRHDLKTPLNMIINYPQMLIEDDNLDPEQTEALRKIEECGHRMLNMVNLSLDMFKMERGAYELQPRPVDLLGAVRHVINELDSMMRSKHLSTRILCNDAEVEDLENECPSAEVDGEELLIYTMLANLIKNAVEASPERETVEIGFRLDRDCEIHVANRGAIPRAIHDRFGEKYATWGKSDGTGLGAYGARLIARAHGGELEFEVDDDADRTTVRVRLPQSVEAS